MDQVRAIAKVIWQQRFWVLSVLGVIIAAVCWNMASGALDTEFAANKTMIQGHFKAMDDIRQAPYHGNDAVNQTEFEQASKIRSTVLALWETMYNLQRDRVLKWPESLGEDFLEYVDTKRFGDPITDTTMIQRYQTYAKERFPKLVEIVQAREMLDPAAGGADGGRMEYGRGRDGGGDSGAGAQQFDENGMPVVEDDYLVEWLDQGVLQQSLNFGRRPTSMQIWVTQEDLWVYETLLQAIANANESRGASRPDNAAIRVIMNLEVGRLAADASKVRGQVILPQSAGGDPAMAGGDGGRMDGGLDAGADPTAALLAGRYIGEDGLPIADATAVSTGEFRMLPVRMMLMMEQRAIPTVLIECANSALPIEVKRVRINAEKSGAGFASTLAVPGAEAAGGGGRGEGDSYGASRALSGMDGGGSRGRDGGPQMSSMMTSQTAGTGLATVEILGVVYIYNPPDPSTLTIPGGEVAEVAAADTGTVGG